jgi:hypothetical protein
MKNHAALYNRPLCWCLQGRMAAKAEAKPADLQAALRGAQAKPQAVQAVSYVISPGKACGKRMGGAYNGISSFTWCVLSAQLAPAQPCCCSCLTACVPAGQVPTRVHPVRGAAQSSRGTRMAETLLKCCHAVCLTAAAPAGQMLTHAHPVRKAAQASRRPKVC